MNLKSPIFLILALITNVALADDGKQGHGDKLKEFDARSIHTMGKEGHGGHGVVCTDSNGSIATVRLFDLWESERVWGIKPADYGSMGWKDIVERRVAQLRRTSFQDVAFLGLSIPEHIQFLRADEKLPEIDDEDEVLLPKHCEKRTIASYLSDSKVLVDTELWNLMSEVDKAGLVMHEAWYRELRQSDAITGSQRVRKINAYFLAEKPFDDPMSDAIDSVAICQDEDWSKKNMFYLALERTPEKLFVRAQFIRLAGESIISRSVSSPVDANEEENKPPSFTGGFNAKDDFDGERLVFLSTMADDARLRMTINVPTNDHRGYLKFDNIVCTGI